MLDKLNIDQDEILTIIISFSIGFIIGFLMSTILGVKGKCPESLLSWLITGIWLVMVTVSFYMQRPIPTFFNVLGFGASGNIIGINFTSLVSSVLKLKRA